MKTKQVNNLKIEYNKKHLWQVVAPDKTILGEFEDIMDAEAYARANREYRKKSNCPKIMTNNVDKLCDMVNEKYNLKPNQIGSIEHYQDMTENSIVQIVNQYRGTRQLIFGDDTVLKKYLANILSDKTVLNFWNVNK